MQLSIIPRFGLLFVRSVNSSCATNLPLFLHGAIWPNSSPRSILRHIFRWFWAILDDFAVGTFVQGEVMGGKMSV
jgi:hypothetical protein